MVEVNRGVAGGEREAMLVVDLGFGDAGKGLVTDHLVRQKGAHTVLRFNGGAQAGHNVVTPDGRHHTFAQLGAGSFSPGVRTHLSRFMVVHPLALLVEARRLEERGAPDPMARLSISDLALVITPFHQAANRLRELARGDAKHGSCGVGVGEAVGDALCHPEDAIRMGALRNGPLLVGALERIRERKRAELEAVLEATAHLPSAEGERRVFEDRGVAGRWLEALAPLLEAPVVVPDAHLGAILDEPGSVVFEGAQGVLLDEWRGFHPHTTWSTCTFDNALELLAEHGYEGRTTRLGVLRAYATRHGAGPFPTEDPELDLRLREPHNGAHPWQGSFRRGHLDPLLLRYALEATGGADALALTHVDALERLGPGPFRACRTYRQSGGPVDPRLFVPAPDRKGEASAIRLGPARDLDHQEALGRALAGVRPVYEEVDLGGERGEARLVEFVEGALGVPVRLSSSGPTTAHVSSWS